MSTPTIVSWASGTDEQIAVLLDAAEAGDIDLQQDAGWAVGDIRTIHVDAFTGGRTYTSNNYKTILAQDVRIVISSFDEYMSCGNVLQFDFYDCLDTRQQMQHSENTTLGGYGATEAYLYTLPGLAGALPAWMKDRLKTFGVPASKGSGDISTIEIVTNNILALRSAAEVFGSAGMGQAERGYSQIGYYSTPANRIKTYGINGNAAFWWLRSPNSASSFCDVNRNGAATAAGATNDEGIAPFGCLGGASVPTFITQPSSASVSEGQSATFSVSAIGTSLSYQWQLSIDNGETWGNISGATSSTYIIASTTVSMSGNKYRCVATNTYGSTTSNAATLTVELIINLPAITSQPQNQTVQEGQAASFLIAASGTNLSYQWQVIQDGTTHTWVSISGATGTTYSISATSALNGKKYRCAVTNEAGTVYSNAATLTVNTQPSPTPTPTPTPSRITNAMRIIINGVDITRFIRFQGLKWSRNDVDGPNAGRNMIGDMIRDRVATKIRIDISCRPLTSDEHQMLMNLIMPEFVTVMYNDPVYGFTSKTMYANNNNSEYCICKLDGREYWHNVTFPLIEK